MRRSKLLVVLAVTTALLLPVSPAQAETITVSDAEPRCSQAPPLDLKRATFTYTDSAFKVAVRMGTLSKRRTQVIARYNWGGYNNTRYDVMLITRYIDGELRTVGRWYDYDSETSGRFVDGLHAVWNWERRTITFKLTDHLRGRRISAAAYTVPKGADHGPPCGDFVQVRGLDRT